MNPNQQIPINASDADLKGHYSNNLRVGFTPEEFVLDFMNVYPPVGVLSARVIISPGHLKRIATALLDTVKQYESQHGKIDQADPPAEDTQIGFKPTQ